MNSNTSGQHTIDVLEHHSLTITQFAQACNVTETWIVQRVQGGVVHPDAGAPDAMPDGSGQPVGAGGSASASQPPARDVQAWRFSGHGIVRTRRIADLERTFDADPQLAALTADLMEEVQQLRALLGQRR